MAHNADILDLEDPILFSRIYNIHFKEVFSVCYGVTEDVEVAKGLTQEIFKSLWERRRELKIVHGLDRYLMKSAKYKAIDYLRREKHRSIIKLDPKPESLDRRRAENDFSYLNTVGEINQVVEQLPTQCKQVYILSREKGLSNKQIASTLMIAEKTVKNHINKALGKLRNHLIIQ